MGPILGAFFGLSTFFVKRSFAKTDSQLNAIAESVEVISHQVTAIQVGTPTNYVNKDEFRHHIGEEERWQTELLHQISGIREEISSVRSIAEYRNHNPHNNY